MLGDRARSGRTQAVAGVRAAHQGVWSLTVRRACEAMQPARYTCRQSVSVHAHLLLLRLYPLFLLSFEFCILCTVFGVTE